MKQKISISIEEKLVHELEAKVESGIFRNKSHLIEFAVNKLIKGENKDEN